MSKKGIIYKIKKKGVYDQKKLFKFREKVNLMYFEEGFGKNEIIWKMHSNKKFVLRWTQSPNQNFEEDNRGWKKGMRRKWNEETIEIIKEIHKSLTDNPLKYFAGATAITQEWLKHYPNVKMPPLRTIGRILSDLKLSGKRKKGRGKGAAKYLCYPEHTIYNLFGGRVLEADFIEKNMKGQTAPINFAGFSFKKAPRLRYYSMISGQTGNEMARTLDEFIAKFEKPDFVKVDNAAANIGSFSCKRNVSNFMIHLLKEKIIPIFSVPRKPFSQASIEGNNSVFSRFFWNRSYFKNIEDIDTQLKWFNKASLEYLEYEKPKTKYEKNGFIPKVYFLRQVKESEQTGNGYIRVVNEIINIRKNYINFFVLAEWNLQEEVLYIYFERNEKSKIIKKIDFKICDNSKKNIKKTGLLLFGQ